MAISTETIESYFEQYGWGYERLDDTHLLTGFNSEVTDAFAIHVTLTSNWVYFTISPFVGAPKETASAHKLYKHLLRLCQQINMAKFTVDSDGDVTLTVELPRQNLDYDEFSDALGALSYYADQTYETIQALATDPNAASGFEEESDLDWGE
jgi:putative sensory transduction regulator